MNTRLPDSRNSEPIRIRRRLYVRVVFSMFLVAAASGSIQWESVRGVLSGKSTGSTKDTDPSEIEEAIEKAPNTQLAIVAAWNTGRIVPRSVAMRELSRRLPSLLPLPTGLENLVLAGVLDVDANVRENAVGILDRVHHPQLASALATQLLDCDPELRLLALHRLKQLEARIGVPLAVQQLDSEDPRVVGLSLNLLGRWSGRDFGVRLVDTVPTQNEINGLPEFRPESRDLARAGAQKAREWWANHKNEFTEPACQPLGLPPGVDPFPSVDDFQLTSLDGVRLRLSSFRGKRVVINFWTTWCSACVGEIPSLNTLQKSHPDDLVVIGVSLDGVPDEHGHVGGHSGVGDGEHGEAAPSLKEIYSEVSRTARKRGIEYAIALDPKNSVGSRFNGGELPTTLLIDKNGKLRRRFVGARPISVFDDMVRELD